MSESRRELTEEERVAEVRASLSAWCPNMSDSESRLYGQAMWEAGREFEAERVVPEEQMPLSPDDRLASIIEQAIPGSTPAQSQELREAIRAERERAEVSPRIVPVSSESGLCECGHSTNWHGTHISEGEAGEGRVEVAQGAGECEHDGDCECEEFTPAHAVVEMSESFHCRFSDSLHAEACDEHCAEMCRPVVEASGDCDGPCLRCGKPCVVGLGGDTYWFADNTLWNEVVPGRVAIYCPACFTALCREAGIGVGWRVGRVGEIEPASTRVPDEGTTQRVLVGDSVYENAKVTVREGRLYVEFESEDLDSVTVDLGFLGISRVPDEAPDEDSNPSETRQAQYEAITRLQGRVAELEAAASRVPSAPGEHERVVVGLIEASDLMLELIKGYKIDQAAEWLKARGFMHDDEPEPETLAGLPYRLESEALAPPSSSAPGDAVESLRVIEGFLRDGGPRSRLQIADKVQDVREGLASSSAPEQVERAKAALICTGGFRALLSTGWGGAAAVDREAYAEEMARAVLDAVSGPPEDHRLARIVTLAKEAAENPNSSEHERVLWEIIDLASGPPESDERREAVVEAIALIRELAADLRNYYAPEKGLPAHIEQAEQVCSDLHNTFVLAAPPTEEER